jgi:serine/threonine protein phosphatase PrpC
MEDRAVTGNAAGGLVVAVFDGHGGSAVAERAARRVLAAVDGAASQGLRGAAWWRAVFTALDVPTVGCGSTATVVWITDRELWAAWVGDSRALLVTESGFRVLTPDHRIERPDERRRVLDAGAVLEPPYVVDPLTGHGLMVTRALGDHELRRVGVIADPEVCQSSLDPDVLAVIVATDGLWDVVGNAEAAEVCRRARAQEAAERLVQMVAEREGSDNVTVIAVRR